MRPLPKDMVRRGYDALSHRYRGDDEEPEHYATWLAQLRQRVRAGGSVLDLGCGCGVPLARDLAGDGYEVTGVDLSAVQIERARRLVPAARFLQADATEVEFPAASFDAVVCLYTLIHLPLDEQPPLLGRIRRWLRPGGWLLATTGHRAWTGTEDHWLGGDTPMWWSHADAATYRAWIEQAGLSIVAQDVVPEGDGAHALFWARTVHHDPVAAGGVLRERGRAVRIGSVVIDCNDFDAMSAFWQEALGYVPREPAEDGWVVLRDPDGKVNVSLQQVPEPRSGKNRLHFDLYTGNQEREVERLLAIGATRHPRTPGPDEDFVVLEDPEGNLFCVVDTG